MFGVQDHCPLMITPDFSTYKIVLFSLQFWVFDSVGPILDDRLKEKSPETLKGCPLFSLSCVSVRNRATEYIFGPRNLIFGLSEPWDMRKKRFFFVFFFNFNFYGI